jgi:signal transduction histidine kinase
MHKLLERQIKHLLGGDPGAVPESFLRAVDRAYRQADEDRELLERSMNLTSEELLERNRELRQQIAERQQLEERVLQAQKMEAVGRLAGGIAHDFNNLLTVIKGYCELCRFRVEHDQHLDSGLGKIAEAAQGAAELVAQLLAYSRQQVLEPRVLDLNRTVAQLEEMLRRLIGEHIEMELDLTADPATVHADEVRIQQVVMNLVINARDAMPKGGRITLRTENVELSEGLTLPHDSEVQPGKMVVLSVRDTGPGIAPEVQPRIFEPFFTTKDLGDGTGLGLATVYGIVKQSGGSVWVESELGAGTALKAALPEAEPQTLREPSSPAIVLPGPVARAKVLVVEDDPVVRTILEEVLSKEHRVLSAASPEQALGHTGEQPPIDVLVTDIVLPEMNGFELAERLSCSWPHLKVLYISGYNPDPYRREGLLRMGINFLPKPFDPSELLLTVREVVSRS